MSYLLDTNTLSVIIRAHPKAAVRFAQEIAGGTTLYLSALVEYELERGVIRSKSSRLRRQLDELLAAFSYAAFERDIWMRAAELWAHSRSIGEPIPDADLLIAAHAMGLGTTLMTHNIKHFQHIASLGLRIEDWQ